MSWIHPDGTIAENQTHYMSTDLAYPSERAWVFGTLKVRRDFPTGLYSCLVSVKCDSGYEIVERREFRVAQSMIHLIPCLVLLSALGKR